MSGDTGGDILFWVAKTGNKVGELNESYGLGFALWSPDSKQLASGSLSQGAETDFHSWNMDTGALNWNLPYVSPTDASWSQTEIWSQLDRTQAEYLLQDQNR
ncbi:MAG: hypothetical protein IPO22_14830 [Anaerolineales bacterium]|nr:hypothetical protein [Anaerolineales bacterium]